jgi:hypothetical protein
MVTALTVVGFVCIAIVILCPKHKPPAVAAVPTKLRVHPMVAQAVKEEFAAMAKLRRRVHPIHYLLHGIFSLLIIGIGTAIDLSILEIRHHHAQAHQVRWADDPSPAPCQFEPDQMPTDAVMLIQMGVRDDGVVVWRMTQFKK